VGSRKPGLEKEALGENAVVQNPRLVGVYLLMKIGCRYHSPSCEAAVVVKPKARLCEPWVAVKTNCLEPRSGDRIYIQRYLSSNSIP